MDEQNKPGSEEQQEQDRRDRQEEHELNEAAASSSTLLRILEEKDKLIVSLKEAATRRDKLNEQQIRLLSHDNQSKTLVVKNIQKRIKDLEYEILRRESEISI